MSIFCQEPHGWLIKTPKNAKITEEVTNMFISKENADSIRWVNLSNGNLHFYLNSIPYNQAKNDAFSFKKISSVKPGILLL